MQVKVLVLEENAEICQLIQELCGKIEDENKKNRKRQQSLPERTIDCEFVSSIEQFKMRCLDPGLWAVVLGSRILEEESEMRELCKWVRNALPKIEIGLNSSDCFDSLAREVRARDLERDPQRIKQFFRFLFSGI